MTQHNMTLYRLLVKGGASEAEAEEAARVDITSDVATKTDLLELRAALADLKTSLIQWTIGIVLSIVGLQTALLLFILNRLVP